MKAWLSVALVLFGAASLHGVHSAPSGQDAPDLTVVLLLDVTASMSRVPLPIDERFAQVFNAFLLGLRPSDRGAVGIVGAHTRFGLMTSNHRDLASNVRVLLQVPESDRYGPSPLWDAIEEALSIADVPYGRSAVILFSDGKSSGNIHGLDEVIAHATARHVTVSAIVEGPNSAFQARTIEGTLDPAELIGRLTNATGGRRLLDRPLDPRQRNPGPMITLIMDALHGRAPDR